jgi:hypothetical protein
MYHDVITKPLYGVISWNNNFEDNRQYNGQTKKAKKTNNGRQSTTQKTE